MKYPIQKLGYTIAETCHVIGIGHTKTYDLIKNGHLKVIKIGRRTIVTNAPEYIALKMREAGHAQAS